jgi:two-component system, chemotaxis family, protein-glutamate methylesterase/glutaminase
MSGGRRDLVVIGAWRAAWRSSPGWAVIKASGGAAIVQDPEEAMYGGKPASAIANVAVDAIVKSDRVASTIAAMVKGEDPSPGASSEPLEPDSPPGEPNPPKAGQGAA